MLITIDGHPGSGKTTFCKKIVQTFGFQQAELMYEDLAFFNAMRLKTEKLLTGMEERVRYTHKNADEIEKIMREYKKIGNTAHLLFHTLSIHLAQNLSWDPKNIVTDDFWHSMINLGRDETLLNYFRHIIQPEPDLSIILKISREESQHRWDRRLAKRLNAKPIQKIKKNTDADRIYADTIAWLAAKVPYIHIIDNMKSEESAWNEIQALIHGKINTHQII